MDRYSDKEIEYVKDLVRQRDSGQYIPNQRHSDYIKRVTRYSDALDEVKQERANKEKSWESWLEKEDKEIKKKPTMFPRIRREFEDEKDEEPMVYNDNKKSWESWLEKDAMDGKQGGSPKDEEPERDYLKEYHDEIKRIKAAGKNDPKRLAYLKDQKENTSKRMQQHLDSNNLINNYSKRLNTNVRNPKHYIGQKRTLDDLGDETNVELGNVKDFAMGNEGYHKKSWESWLEKNNAIETSHKKDEKKDEWDGKFSSSTIRDDVKDDDDKAVSEEESLEELTDGKLEEVEKLKSWEIWLEKDALDGKGGNEAKDDLMMPSLMGMYKKPTKQTKEGQARDYVPDTPHVDSYHMRRLGHGEKYESGRRPLEKKPQSGGFVNEPRKEEWDITADQDAQQRGSGKNTFDDKDDVEPAGGFIQGQGRTVPKTGIAPNIKPQGKGVKHRGRPRGSKNKAWENWLEKKSRFKPSNPLHRNIHPHNIPIKDDPYYKNVDLSVDYSQTADARAGDDEYDAIRREKIRRETRRKSWELWLDKNEKWDKDEKEHDKHIKHGKSKKDAIADMKALHRHMREERQRDDDIETNEIIGDVKNPILAETQNKPRPTPSIMPKNLTHKKPKYVKGVEQKGDVADERDTLNIQIADSMKSWESWLDKNEKWDKEEKELDKKYKKQRKGKKGKKNISSKDAKDLVRRTYNGQTPNKFMKQVNSNMAADEEKHSGNRPRGDKRVPLTRVRTHTSEPLRYGGVAEDTPIGASHQSDHQLRTGRKEQYIEPENADLWKSWLEKMQGAGDARFGNQHLTGLDQKPVDNEEDEANILPEKEEKTDNKEEKQEKTEDKEDKDNKPYKALSQE